MTLSELLPLLRELGLQPSRKLGQNFLIDPNILARLIDSAAPQPGERIVEIGAGTGVLTRALLAAGADVVAVEYDVRLAEYLRSAFADNPKLTLIQADACRVDFDALVGDTQFACIANLPYSVSSVVMGRLMELRNRPARLCLLLQREMAERLAAVPDNRIYGSLSVRTQALYSVRIERIVPPTVFYPAPDVESAVVLLRPSGRELSQVQYAGFGAMVRLAFSQRRKMLHKLLKGAYDRQALDAAFAQLGLAPTTRGEALTVEHFLALYALLGAPAGQDGSTHHHDI